MERHVSIGVDHLSVLLRVFFGGLFPRPLKALTCEDIDRREDGLLIRADGREIFIDRYPEEAVLDILTVYDSYRDSIEWETGSLFRSPRGHRGDLLIACNVAREAPWPERSTDACRRVNISVRSATASIRHGFRIEAVRAFGVVITANHLGLKDPKTLLTSSGAARAEIKQMRGGRRAFGKRSGTHRSTENRDKRILMPEHA